MNKGVGTLGVEKQRVRVLLPMTGTVNATGGAGRVSGLFMVVSHW